MDSATTSTTQVPTTSTTQEPTQVPTQVPVITTQDKTKNPGRVAAGKRLAAISKAARERKKLATTGPKDGPSGNTGTTSVFDSVFSYQNILALIGISIGAAALFYELYPKKDQQKQAPDNTSVTIRPSKLHEAGNDKLPKKSTNLESFD